MQEPLVQTLDDSLQSVNTSLRSGFDNLKQLFARQREYAWREREAAEQQTHDFEKDIYPVLRAKCLACHACYDAPCQLKLENAEGLERGASKIRLYNGLRLGDTPPTRLGIDAQSAAEWRRLGFFGVLDSRETDTPPLLQDMIDLGRSNPVPAGAPIPEDMVLGIKRQHACPEPGEFARYRAQNPHGGMPLAMAGLTDTEYRTLSTWLDEGAVTPAADAATETIDDAAASQIDAWEDWLNRDDRRSKLLSRYLYEHLYLGHLYLRADEDGPPGFYSLIRSHTAAPAAPVPVATLRPNDPVEGAFHYRLVAIDEAIIHKTHITYRFDASRRRELTELFESRDWSVQKLPGYDADARANPFETFAAIPPRLRYRFLLNDALYYVRSFIRGPVCRGQIATDVIRDQFWVMFEAPAEERYTNRESYRAEVTPLLGVPGQKSSLIALGPEYLDYRSGRNRYLDRRAQQYAADFPQGPDLSQVWNGEGDNHSAFLTVFRHHDSASVIAGWQGELPVTTWLMDYPLLERTYYELVVGFNVFGSVSHQAQTRLYFDLIRNEAETNFLRLLPPGSRQQRYDSWYQYSGRLKTLISYHELDTTTPTQVTVGGEDSYAGVLDKLRARSPALTGGHDEINRPATDSLPAGLDDAQREMRRALQRLAARPASELDAVRWMPDVTFLRVDYADGRREPFTLLRNRRHSNVAFMLGESLRYQEDRDSLSILPALVGSYPNLMLRVDANEVRAFVQAVVAIDDEAAMHTMVERWGLRRMDPELWPVFHSFSDLLRQRAPVEAGIYDLNRYGRW
ncbi:MAG: fatty acid cis/trans isomerase [Chromatocurvus sp.]